MTAQTSRHSMTERMEALTSLLRQVIPASEVRRGWTLKDLGVTFDGISGEETWMATIVGPQSFDSYRPRILSGGDWPAPYLRINAGDWGTIEAQDEAELLRLVQEFAALMWSTQS